MLRAWRRFREWVGWPELLGLAFLSCLLYGLIGAPAEWSWLAALFLAADVSVVDIIYYPPSPIPSVAQFDDTSPVLVWSAAVGVRLLKGSDACFNDLWRDRSTSGYGVRRHVNNPILVSQNNELLECHKSLPRSVCAKGSVIHLGEQLTVQCVNLL